MYRPNMYYYNPVGAMPVPVRALLGQPAKFGVDLSVPVTSQRVLPNVLDDNNLHDSKRHNVVFMCPECQQISPFLEGFAKHIKDEHGSVRMSAIVRLQCTVCGEFTGSETNFSRHFQQRHQQLSGTATPVPQSETQQNITPKAIYPSSIPPTDGLGSVNIAALLPMAAHRGLDPSCGMAQLNITQMRCAMCLMDKITRPHLELIYSNNVLICKVCYTSPLYVPDQVRHLADQPYTKQEGNVSFSTASNFSSDDSRPSSKCSGPTSDLLVSGKEAKIHTESDEDMNETSEESARSPLSSTSDAVTKIESVSTKIDGETDGKMNEALQQGINQKDISFLDNGSNLDEFGANNQLSTRHKDKTSVSEIKSCPFCNIELKSTVEVKSHLQNNHSAKQKLQKAASSKDMGELLQTLGSLGKIVCNSADIANHSSIVCEVCKESCETEAEFDNHLSSAHPKALLKCVICEKTTFTTTQSCLSHMEDTHGFLDIACLHCKLTFPEYLHLRRHLREEHLKVDTGTETSLSDPSLWGEKLDLTMKTCCWLCGKNVKSAQGLQHHIKAKHNEKE